MPETPRRGTGCAAETGAADPFAQILSGAMEVEPGTGFVKIVDPASEASHGDCRCEEEEPQLDQGGETVFALSVTALPWSPALPLGDAVPAADPVEVQHPSDEPSIPCLAITPPLPQAFALTSAEGAAPPVDPEAMGSPLSSAVFPVEGGPQTPENQKAPRAQELTAAEPMPPEILPSPRDAGRFMGESPTASPPGVAKSGAARQEPAVAPADEAPRRPEAAFPGLAVGRGHEDAGSDEAPVPGPKARGFEEIAVPHPGAPPGHSIADARHQAARDRKSPGEAPKGSELVAERLADRGAQSLGEAVLGGGDEPAQPQERTMTKAEALETSAGPDRSRPAGQGVERLWGYWLRRGSPTRLPAMTALSGAGKPAELREDSLGAQELVSPGHAGRRSVGETGTDAGPSLGERVPEGGLPGSAPAARFDAPVPSPQAAQCLPPGEVPAAVRADSVGSSSAARPSLYAPLPTAPAEQVVRAVRISLSREGDRVTVQLRPESLGKVELVVAREGGELAARFRVETPEAHQALLAEAPALRHALESKGITLAHVWVDLEGRQGGRGAPREGRKTGRRTALLPEEELLGASPARAGRNAWGFDARV